MKMPLDTGCLPVSTAHTSTQQAWGEGGGGECCCASETWNKEQQARKEEDEEKYQEPTSTNTRRRRHVASRTPVAQRVHDLVSPLVCVERLQVGLLRRVDVERVLRGVVDVERLSAARQQHRLCEALGRIRLKQATTARTTE
jgi:hypothetical protein